MPLGKIVTSEKAEKIKDELVELTGLRGDQLARLAIAVSLKVNEGKRNVESEDKDGYEINPYTLTRNGRDPWIEAVFSFVYRRDLSLEQEMESLMRYVTYHVNQGFYILGRIMQESSKKLDVFYARVQNLTDREAIQSLPGDNIPPCRLLIGSDARKQVDVCWEMNNSQQYPSSHLAIIGRTGYGKTQLLKWLLYELHRNTGGSVPCLIFDYKGDLSSDVKFTKAIQAKVYNPEDSPIPVHLFELSEYSEKRFQRFAAQFQEAFSAAEHLGTVQERRLRNAIIQAYQSLQGQAPSYPDFEDVYRIVCEQTEAGEQDDTLIEVLDRLVSFNLFPKKSDVVQSPSLFRQNSIIDLSKLSAYHELVVYLLLNKIYHDMKSQGDAVFIEGWREMRLVIALDEAHHYLAERSPALERLLREGRSFGMSVWLCTQNLSDLVHPQDYSELVGNVLLFNVGRVSENDLRRLVGIDRSRASRLRDEVHRLPPGECIWNHTLHDLPYAQLWVKQFYQEFYNKM